MLPIRKEHFLFFKSRVDFAVPFTKNSSQLGLQQDWGTEERGEAARDKLVFPDSLSNDFPGAGVSRSLLRVDKTLGCRRQTAELPVCRISSLTPIRKG